MNVLLLRFVADQDLFPVIAAFVVYVLLCRAYELVPLPVVAVFTVHMAGVLLLAADQGLHIGVAACVMLMRRHRGQPAHQNTGAVIAVIVVRVHHVIGLAADQAPLFVQAVLIVDMDLDLAIEHLGRIGHSVPGRGQHRDGPHRHQQRQAEEYHQPALSVFFFTQEFCRIF